MSNQATTGDQSIDVTVAGVRFEHLRNALGIGVARPRLSWVVATAADGWRQAGYEIESYGPDGRLREQTGRVESDASVLVDWPFAPLSSRQRIAVRVRVWGADGRVSAWSAPAPTEVGLLNPADWDARFVTPDWDEDTSKAQPGPLLRREFAVRAGVAQARLYITSQGVYEAQLNGAVVGDHVLAPGWTSYNHRLRYQTFDVTSMLREGPNALGAMLGDGWYRGRLSFGGGRRNIYGDRLALLAQLEITYADGTADRVITDASWRAARGPILASDVYDGETYDARLERVGWAEVGYDDAGWVGVRPVERDLAKLVAPSGPPVRRTQQLEPIAISSSPSGRTIVDFGQNLVGRLRLMVQGPAGQTITLRHAEVLENGELATRPLRHAAATDRYTLRGGGPETWEPRFTFHGFRYAEIDGWPGELRPGDLRAIVCHSDMERTGWFECSDPLINRLHENVVWGMRGNFLDIPTDCPQRDERLGWTGDIQVFSPTACFLYDTAGFLQSWLADLAAEQRQLGVVPFVVPEVMGRANPPAAAWGDAAVIVPWVLYQRYGDVGILAQQFDSMCAWVDLIAEKAGARRLWDHGFQFGDWLDPNAPPDKPGAARTSPQIVASAYFVRSAELTSLAAGVLGRAEDEQRYQALAAEAREAFNREYVTPNGRLLSDATTAYALAIEFALLRDEEQRRHAGARLAALVRESGYRISTGFVGTPLICDALCHVGEYDTAFRLLIQRRCPSWLYPVTMGATTIWERWDSMLPDGSVNPGEMTSFNHYALGAVADWLHRTVAGLAPAAPGYRRLAIQPRPGGGLTHARARHRTPYGMAEASWKLEAGQITVEAVVPPGVTASVSLPGGDAAPIEIGPGAHRWAYAYQIAQAQRPAPTLDSSFVDLADHPEAWAAVRATIGKHAPELASSMDGGMQGNADMTLRQLLPILPNAEAIQVELEGVLRQLKG
ncbi:MAG TPA: glycoside hydrolase family 78 protein [Roseiflexaceae bacterium]|nr:glycoside hydrolase family 78 protein [Roseiflexaceae bacterium]